MRADAASGVGIGIGKPELLKHNLSGLWSKRISQKDRLIYKFNDEYIYSSQFAGTLRPALEKIAIPKEQTKQQMTIIVNGVNAANCCMFLLIFL